MCMEVRGRPRKVGSLLLCGDQGSNSGHKVWKQEILIIEPSQGISIFYTNNKYQELYDRGPHIGGCELTLRIPDCLKQLDKITLSSIQTISFHFRNSPMTHRIFLNYKVRFRECQ